MKTEGKINTSINLPCTLKALYIEVLFVNIDSIDTKTNLNKTDFGIRTILRKKLPYECVLVVNNISFYNLNTFAPTIKNLVFVFGLPDIDGILKSIINFSPNSGIEYENREYEDLDKLFKFIIKGAKWASGVDKINEAIDINYTLVNKNVFDTYVVYPSKLFFHNNKNLSHYNHVKLDVLDI